jgi:hypothetical protein
MLIPPTIHLSSRDNKPDLKARIASTDPQQANESEAVCHVTRKIRIAGGFNPVDEACNFGKISRSPRYEWPNAPKKEGRAANRNKALVMV